MDGRNTHTFFSYRVAETLLRVGPFADNPLLVEYSLSGERRTIKTDALCGVSDPNEPPPVFFFIELDTGSQSHATIGHKAMA